jgi:hypothetical protein
MMSKFEEITLCCLCGAEFEPTQQEQGLCEDCLQLPDVNCCRTCLHWAVPPDAILQLADGAPVNKHRYACQKNAGWLVTANNTCGGWFPNERLRARTELADACDLLERARDSWTAVARSRRRRCLRADMAQSIVDLLRALSIMAERVEADGQ